MRGDLGGAPHVVRVSGKDRSHDPFFRLRVPPETVPEVLRESLERSRVVSLHRSSLLCRGRTLFHFDASNTSQEPLTPSMSLPPP